MPTSRSRTVPAALACAVLLGCALLGGCTPDTGDGSGRPGRAAEPADSPVPVARPAGSVQRIGERPEGLAVDPRSHVVAVAVRNPPRLLLLDGMTGETVRRVPLPGTVRHVQLAAPGGPFLVPVETTDELFVVRTDGTIAARMPVGDSPHDAVRAQDGTLFVADEKGGDVAAIRDGAIVHRFATTQPGGLAAAGATVGGVDVARNVLSIYDPQELRVVGDLPVGSGPTHVVSDKFGRYDVVDTRGGQLLRIAPDPGLAQQLALPGSPYGIAYDKIHDRLWVTLTARNEVVGIDLGHAAHQIQHPGRAGELKPIVTYRYPTVRQPNTVAVDAVTGRVFVGGAANGELQLIDPRQADR